MTSTPVAVRSSLLVLDAIENLYRATEVAPATAARPIVPLGRLIKSLDGVQHTELSDLSSRAAAHFLAARGGLSTPLPEADNAPLAGFLFANPSGGRIFVRAGDPVARRRFSAAHELGHFLLHFPIVLREAQECGREGEAQFVEALPPSLVGDGEETSFGKVLPSQNCNNLDSNDKPVSALPSLEKMEREADSFAAELLMPQDVVFELADRYRAHLSDADLVWRLAGEMLVSRAAMRLRLRHLNLLRDGVAQSN